MGWSNSLIFFLHFLGLIFTFHFWFRDLLRELAKKYEILLMVLFLVFLLFIVSEGLLFVSFFWFFGHPEVYILIIPAFGVISIIISGVSQRIIFGNQSMIFAMSCISLLGSVV